MLKLIYSDTGLHLEQVMTPLETVLSQRVILATRMSYRVHIEPSSAAFLLPVSYPHLRELDEALRQDKYQGASLCPVDAEFVEVALKGQWIADSADAHEGTFLATLSDRAEFFVLKAWNQSQFVTPIK